MKIKNTEIKIVQGDITEQETEAIVNPANNRLIMGGGVAGAIKRKGGEEIQKECNKIGPIEIGEAVVTGAGKLRTKYIIHAATMGMDFATDEKKIRLATKNALKRAEEKRIKALAFPALGCGVGGFSLEDAAKIMSEEVLRHLDDHPKSSLKEIRFVLFDKEGFNIFNQTVPEHIEYLQRKRGKYPVPTVDIIIEIDEGFILIERKNPPYGWAIPGGFVNWGESLEEAAIREAKEETGLEIKDLVQLHTYSEPNRDPRFHTISTVFVAKGIGKPKADTDAKSLKIFTPETLPQEFAFDHKKIIEDYFVWRRRKKG